MISKDFFNKGYCIIDDFLDSNVSNVILQKFKKEPLINTPEKAFIEISKKYKMSLWNSVTRLY